MGELRPSKWSDLPQPPPHPPPLPPAASPYGVPPASFPLAAAAATAAAAAAAAAHARALGAAQPTPPAWPGAAHLGGYPQPPLHSGSGGFVPAPPGAHWPLHAAPAPGAPQPPYAPPPAHHMPPTPAPTGFIPAPGGIGRVFVPPPQAQPPPAAVATIPPPPPSGSGFAHGPGGVGRVFFPPADKQVASRACTPDAAGDGGRAAPAASASRRRFREEEAVADGPSEARAEAKVPRRSFRESAEGEPPKPTRRRFTEEADDDRPSAHGTPASNVANGAGGATGGKARRPFREEESPVAAAPLVCAVAARTSPAHAPAKPPAEDDLAKWGLLPNNPRSAPPLPVLAAHTALDATAHAGGGERPGLGAGPAVVGAGVGPEAPAPRLGGLNRYLPLSEIARLTAQAGATELPGGAAGAGTVGGAAAHGASADGDRLESSNLGHQMLTKMGWAEGRGLQPAMSVEREGIAEPIYAGEVLKRGERPGLGLARQHTEPARPAQPSAEGAESVEAFRQRMSMAYDYRADYIRSKKGGQ
ncbi:hypothetical protein KFE25_000065 [Diacronema lutheri]|uniref:G-patch domain-containing protein n=2 Tax=Diacronema lutheri TaxID=2081491 RepID=A0A8J6C6U8_DIALT|nr:hypothetical protein KFE25_000065 [Diacronema lutheri]